MVKIVVVMYDIKFSKGNKKYFKKKKNKLYV